MLNGHWVAFALAVQCLLDQLRGDAVLGLDVLLPPDLVSLVNWGGRKGPWRRLQRRVSSYAMAALIAKAEVAGRYDVIARVVSGAHSLAAAQLLDPEVITRVPAAPFVAFHNVAKGLPPPGFREAGELTCACGKPLTATHMLVCAQGGIPHQGQVGRRVAHVSHEGGAKDQRHDAVALELAEQLRRVVHERRVMISEKRLGHTTTVPLAEQPPRVEMERVVHAQAPSADVLLTTLGGVGAAGVAFDVTMPSVLKADGTAVQGTCKRVAGGKTYIPPWCSWVGCLQAQS